MIISTHAYNGRSEPTTGVHFSVIFYSVQYPTDAEKHQEPMEKRGTEHAFSHGVVDLTSEWDYKELMSKHLPS